MSKTIKIVFKPFRKTIEASTQRTILDFAREADISIRADCGGLGVCGKCVVRVEAIDGVVSPPTSDEVTLLGELSVRDGYRLACRTRVLEGSVEVYVPSESLVQRYKSADTGLEKHILLSPAVMRIRVRPPEPSLNDVRSDLGRVLDELERMGISVDSDKILIDVVRALPRIVREAFWDLDVIVWNNMLLDVIPHSDRFRPIGAAIDIGTSRIVLHLVDLESGETIAIESMPNPQASYGADIISRLAYASKSDNNLLELHRVVVGAVNNLIRKACSRAGVPREWIYEVVVVGNTVMHHLFLGIDVKYLGLAPYTPALKGPIHLYAKELSLDVNRNAIVYLPPVIAGFLGSDAIADAVAVDIDECREPCALIDIGTNTEIIVNTGKKIVAGSTPAGPAFEGASMTFGMRASEGAIDQVFIYFDRSIGDYAVRYNVIGGKKPSGICGSGYIDIVANLYRLGLINARGRFSRSITSARLKVINGTTRFIVAEAGETAIGRDIAVDERDIESLLLAKAAVASGLKTLLRLANLSEKELARVYVAGSFGSYLNIENAIAIGLLPRVPISRYIFVGNASIVGAKAMLKSREVREKTLSISRRIEYVELATRSEFKEVFVESLYLPPAPDNH